MKFRNKKTREVVKIYPALHDETAIRFMAEGGKNYEYKSLADFNKEWEDAPEEPKKYWFIDVGNYEVGDVDEDNADLDADKEIGNYFETKEEAEKAVEKLRAYKRLKDRRFEFGKWRDEEKECYDGQEIGSISFRVDFIGNNDIKKDIDLLFGGEE